MDVHVLTCFIAPRYNGTRLYIYDIYIYIQTGNRRKWEWKCTISCSLNPFPFCVRPNLSISFFSGAVLTMLILPNVVFILGCNYIRRQIQITILEGNFPIDHNDDTNPDATEEYFLKRSIQLLTEFVHHTLLYKISVKFKNICIWQNFSSFFVVYFATNHCLSSVYEIEDIYASLWHKDLN